MTGKSGHYVYFIKPIGMDGPVKIGCSDIPEIRLKALTCWSPFPLEIAVTIPGDTRLEGRLHSTFGQHHSHHEWFLSSPELRQLIHDLKGGAAVENAICLSEEFGGLRVHKKRFRPKNTPFKTRYLSYKSRVDHAVKRARKITSRNISEPGYISEHIHALGLSSESGLDVSQDLLESLDEFLLEPEKYCIKFRLSYRLRRVA